MNAPKPLEKVEEIRGELENLIERIPKLPGMPPGEPSDVKFIFVAVHGVGDQFRFETIQSVSYAVCRYVGQPAAIPLGRYHDNKVEISGAYVPSPGRDPDVKCGFAEMYWADVPRESVDEKYTLEETRKWARNIAARLDLLARTEVEEKHPAKPEIDAANETLKAAHETLLYTKTCVAEAGRNLELGEAPAALEKTEAARKTAEAAQQSAEEEVKHAEAKAAKVRKALDPVMAAWRKENQPENDLIQNLLEEVIQGVTIADRLAYVAEKAGLFKLELKKLLLDYVDDIQVVTEFQGSRDRLVAKFGVLMTLLADKYPKAEIHVVSHSEGTVVSLLGLIEGFRAAAAADAAAAAAGKLPDKLPSRHWIKQVHGLMTFGSPLNKHIKLWPELFRVPGDEKEPPLAGPEPKIQWRNYYDYGDPIGFDLEPTRLWLKSRKDLSRFFTFSGPEDLPEGRDTVENHDIGFTRYPFPGKAHIDYWTDKQVFGHYLATVVDPEGEVLRPADPAAAKILGEYQALPKSADEANEARKLKALVKDLDKYWRPRDIEVWKITSYVLPYLAAAVLLLIGVYLLYTSIRAYLVPLDVQFETSGQLATNVLGLAALVAGVSLLARIPCLTPRLTFANLWVSKAEAQRKDLDETKKASIDARRETQRQALAALGWRTLAVQLALLSLGYFAVSESNRTSIERFLVDPGPALGPFSFELQGWYGLKSFEVLMPALIFVLLALAWRFGGDGFRPPVLVLGPSLFAWLVVRGGLAGMGAPTANVSPGFTRYLSSPYLIEGIAIALGIWLLVAARLIEGRNSIKRFIAVAVMVGLVLLIHWSYRDTLAAIPVRTASLAFVGLTWLIGVIAWQVGRHYPKFGAKPLIHTGGFVLLLVIGFGLVESWRPSPASTHRREAEINLKARIERLNNVMKTHPDWVLPANDAPLKATEVAACGCCLTSFPRGAEGEPTTIEGFRAEAAEVAALHRLIEATPSHGPIWPVVGFAPVFLYIWWLAIMTFDLTFIWHLYIRHGGARDYVTAMIARAAKMGENPPAPAHPHPVSTPPSRSGKVART